MNRHDHARFGFASLMPNLVKNVLMVASPYDCFILEEDGRFSDRMFKEYAELDLANPPHFEHVTSGKAAMERLRKKQFDLILMTPHCADCSPEHLAKKIRHKYPTQPVVMLTYDRAEAQSYCYSLCDHFLHVFTWTGDPKLLVAIVKIVEDSINVKHDTHHGSVRVILVVEDSPSDYSSFVPAMYNELLLQLHTLIPERLNARDRNNRMRARPKILLATSYEEAMSLYRQYGTYLLGVVCDTRFPRKQQLRARAGVSFLKHVRRKYPHLPMLLQSFESENKDVAETLGIPFADKRSEDFLRTIAAFMKNHFGFGDFQFRNKDGLLLGRASTLAEMRELLLDLPAEIIRDHAYSNDYSSWLYARSEFRLASELRPRSVNEFQDLEEVREFLLTSFDNYIEQRQRGRISDFTPRSNFLARDFIRVGTGSMGGKARGVAFISHLLAEHDDAFSYEDIKVLVPRSVVLCTDLFDTYILDNHLEARAAGLHTDEEIAALFLSYPLTEEINQVVRKLVQQVDYPLAVRSSSVLEDSTFQPIAGLYKTFMIPNNATSEDVRFEQLSRAIRLVIASSFAKKARKYLESHALRPEQEKMAVLIQRLVGKHYEHRFYPHFSGVAQSYNYYPMGGLSGEDGIVTVALGLGRTVVEGRKAFRFSPNHPNVQAGCSAPLEIYRASQRDFFALDFSNPDYLLDENKVQSISNHDLSVAEKDGTLTPIGASYSANANMIYDTIYREGAKLVNFSGVLKYDRFPLAELLQKILAICKQAMGGPVELEFAVSLGKKSQLAILELRPLIAMGQEREVNLDEAPESQEIIMAGSALGNGVIRNIYDVVYIHPERFNMVHSETLAREIEKINTKLRKQHRPYILVGPGRWGSADRWLGIPVKWSQVSGAQVIVEIEIPELHIDPSQGTHFFHNLISLRVGYFSLNLKKATCLNLDFLESFPAETEAEGIRHVCLPKPLESRIDGRIGKGVILYGEPRAMFTSG